MARTAGLSGARRGRKPAAKTLAYDDASLLRLHDASVEDILNELARRGGVVKAVAEAQLLVLKKSADYNQTGMKTQTSEAAAFADRDVYFPFGTASYVQMIHVKSQRLISLQLKAMSGGAANFEGVKDTAADLINYSAFLVERLEREAGKGAVQS